MHPFKAAPYNKSLLVYGHQTLGARLWSLLRPDRPQRGKQISGTVRPLTMFKSLYARGAPAGADIDIAGGSEHAVRRGVRMSVRAN